MTTPIDPTDVQALNLVANKAYVDSVRWEAIRDAPSKTLVIIQSVVPAVARAVLPEGYVAVPVETLRFVIDADQWDDDTYFRAVETLRSLLPAAEATR